MASTIVKEGEHINCGDIARLENNNAIQNATLDYSSSADTETEIDVTGMSGIYIKASDTMKYSLDGGSTYTDFEMEDGKAQYLNKTVGIDKIKVKNDNDDTKFTYFMSA